MCVTASVSLQYTHQFATKHGSDIIYITLHTETASLDNQRVIKDKNLSHFELCLLLLHSFQYNAESAELAGDSESLGGGMGCVSYARDILPDVATLELLSEKGHSCQLYDWHWQWHLISFSNWKVSESLFCFKSTMFWCFFLLGICSS